MYKHLSKHRLSCFLQALTIVAAFAFVLSEATVATGAEVSLPYGDGFEGRALGSLSTADGWSVTNGGATVINSPVLAGSRACSITNGGETVRLTLNIDTNSGDYANVWVQYFAKPVCYDDSSSAPTVSNETCAFYVNTGGTLRAYTTNAVGDNVWTNLMSVDTNVWLGFAVHIDYSNSVWDLYVSQSGTRGGAMAKANTDWSLGVNTNSANAEVEQIIVEGQAELDNMGAGFAAALLGDTTETNVVSMDTLAGTNMLAVPVHYYSGNADRLDDTFGDDLATGLKDGDKARFYWTNGWNVYTYSSGSWTNAPGDDGTDVTNFHAKGRAMWLERGNTSGIAFFPFDAEDFSVSIDVSGSSDSSVAPGWNLVAWPFTESRSINSGNNFDSVATNWGDRIYLQRNGRYVRLYWDNANNVWKEGRNISSETLEAGEAFWWYHEGESNTWTVSQP